MKVWGYYGLVAFIAGSIGLLANSSTAFEYAGYCQKMCMWGRGGNLCKCNAVHFAGKRGSLSPQLIATHGEEDALPGESEEGFPRRTMEEDVEEEGVGPAGLALAGHHETLRRWLEEATRQGSQQLDPASAQAKTKKYLLMALRKIMKMAGSSSQRHVNRWESDIKANDYDSNM